MIKFWGVEEVGNWLESLGLAEYKERFAKNDIQGEELLGLDRNDLKVSINIWTHTYYSFYFATAGTVCKIVLFFFSFFKFVSLPPPRLGSPIRGWKLSCNCKVKVNE